MNLLKKINLARRRVMQMFTRTLATARPDEWNIPKDAVRKILICRPNHRLGNMLLVGPLIQDIQFNVPGVEIDLLVKGGVAPILFKNYPGIRRIITLPKKPMKGAAQYMKGLYAIRKTKYDIAVNVVFNSSSGRLAVKFANARFRFFGEHSPDVEGIADHSHMAKFPVYNFRSYLRDLKLPVSDRPVPPLDLKLSEAEMTEGRKLLATLVEGDKQTICLYTYATGVKCYSKEWWQKFYERLSKRYPDFSILEVLPVENVSQLTFQIPHFYSRDLRQIGSVIANSALFIGADSGMMHLASAVPTPVIGLFKSHNANTYAPYNEGSSGINTEEASFEELFQLIDRTLTTSLRRKASA